MNLSGGGGFVEEPAIVSLPLDFSPCPGQPATEDQDEAKSFMQSRFWARFKSRTGWKAFALRYGSEMASPRDDLIALARPLGLGFHFVYIPHGPDSRGFEKDAGARLESLAAALAKAISARLGGRLLFLRFDLAWNRGEEPGAMLLESLGKGWRGLRRGSDVQVPDTVILNIERTEEAILAGMKPKWRYNIKLAEKKGVEVSREGAEALETFYALYLETARRDGIAIHPLSYYRTLFASGENETKRSGEAAPRLSVWVARHEGLAIASIITLYYGKHATYLYGASSGEKRNLMPAYALQWRAIQAARAEGCSDYDFFGIPPDDSPEHPMAGLYLFKTGFGGDIVHRAGCVDYPVSPLAYRLFRAAESARLIWYKRIKKYFKGAGGRG